jgi:hypothetical protein
MKRSDADESVTQVSAVPRYLGSGLHKVKFDGGGSAVVAGEAKKERSRGKPNVVLGARDIEILALVAEQRFALLEQLSRRFFLSQKSGPAAAETKVELAHALGRIQSPHKAAYRRAWKLVQAGHLVSRHVPMDKAQIYQVGKRGLAVLEDQTGAEWPYLPDIDLKNFRHDRMVTDLRIMLEPRTTSWSSERFMRMKLAAAGESGHIPDALLTVLRKGNPVRVALEMEPSLKTLNRYPSIFGQYVKRLGTDVQISHVLYFCGKGVRQSLMRQKEISESGYLFGFLDIDDWMEHGFSAAIVWGHGKRHTLGDVF